MNTTKPQNKPSGYWNGRKDSIYLHAAKLICAKYGKNAKSVLDVGSNGTPTLEWHRKTAASLTSLDLRKPYMASGIKSLTLDFFDYQPLEKFDLVTCFQVLEHIPDPSAFAKKLLQCGKVVIASVPYRWKEGDCKFHLHDPVTNKMMEEWFNQKPAFVYLARELNKQERVIHVYKENSK